MAAEMTEVKFLDTCMRLDVTYLLDPRAVCYVALYVTDAAGQWMLISDVDFGPFDDTAHVRAVIAGLFKGWLRTIT